MHHKSIALPLIVSVGLWVIVQDSSDVAASPQNARRPVTKDSKPNCTNHEQILDNCAQQTTYSFIQGRNVLPTSAKELQASCQAIPDNIKCVKNYAKCLDSLGRRMAVAFANGRSKHSKKMCANLDDPKSVDFYKSFECAKTTKNKLAALGAIEKDLGSAIQYLTKTKSLSFDERFNKLCCEALEYRTKIVASFAPECAKYTATQREFADSTTGDLLELACPDSKRLETEICPKSIKLPASRAWTPITITHSAIDFVIALSEVDSKRNQ